MRVERLTPIPILSTATHPEAGDNINGPSLIRVPDWVQNPLARYYLYFAHHNGRYIRLACSDALAGPWKVLPNGVLPLSASGFSGHIASPDIHIDEGRQRIMMYFHGSDRETDAQSPQHTRLAESSDGLDFTTLTGDLGPAYWRAFHWNGYTYTLEMPGVFRRSKDAVGPFEKGPVLFSDRMRHSAVALDDDFLDVYFSNIGDNPERILHTRIHLADDWNEWSTGEVKTVASPSGIAEGANCKAVPSCRGIALFPVRELRDPACFHEDGISYLLFSVAGEQGISIARLSE